MYSMLLFQVLLLTCMTTYNLHNMYVCCGRICHYFYLTEDNCLAFKLLCTRWVSYVLAHLSNDFGC